MLWVLCSACCCGSTVIDFEQFSDGDHVTNQISGVQFTNTTVATAGISLNEIDFPPHSGVNVGFDDGGPTSILFSSPITDLSAYFNYTVPLTMAAFNSGNQIASAVSLFSNNLAASGDPSSHPNELLGVGSPQGITQIIITGDPAGGSFTMDDVSFQAQETTAIPEPYLAPLLGVLTLSAIARRRVISGGNRWEN